MSAIPQEVAGRPASLTGRRRRRLIGYFLRHCGNLHYFAAIKPYLDHYLRRADVENRILVQRRSPDIENEPDFHGYAHLFDDRLGLDDCDLVLTPTFLRPEDRPGLQRAKTRLVQIFHGMSDKPFTYERDFSDYDLCLCVGQRQLDRLLKYAHNRTIRWSLVGYPKFDAVPRIAEPVGKGRRTVIYCPTWRKGGISSLERFLDSPSTIARLTERYYLIVKPHPNLFNPERPFFDQSIVDRLQTVPGITLVRAGNALPWFARAEIFIGDVSAAGYEWLYFGRPMIFLNPQPGVLAPSGDVEAMTYLWQCGEVCDEVAQLPIVSERNLETDRYTCQRERLLRYSVYRPRDKGATERGIKQIDALLTTAAGSERATSHA